MRRLLLAIGLAAALPAAAAVLSTTPNDDLIGEWRTEQVRPDDTLLDIARRHDLGYEEIVQANPGVDPWVPPVGATVQVPTQFLLPAGPRRGLVIDLARMRLFHYTLAPTGSGVVTTHPLGIGREFRLPAAGETRTFRREFTVRGPVKRAFVVAASAVASDTAVCPNARLHCATYPPPVSAVCTNESIFTP